MTQVNRLALAKEKAIWRGCRKAKSHTDAKDQAAKHLTAPSLVSQAGTALALCSIFSANHRIKS